MNTYILSAVVLGLPKTVIVSGHDRRDAILSAASALRTSPSITAFPVVKEEFPSWNSFRPVILDGAYSPVSDIDLEEIDRYIAKGSWRPTQVAIPAYLPRDVSHKAVAIAIAASKQ